MKHAIIGAGPAGVIAAETLRKINPTATITIIGDEPEPPYSRMALPYYLTNKITEDNTYLRKKPDHFTNKDIDIVRDRVLKVDTGSKSLMLENNSAISFDKLLIATGSKPNRPPIEGIDLPGVHNCWTLDDARQIIKRATPNSSVVLIGAGFIGSIILEALSLRKVNLTVVEMGDRMVPRMMDSMAGNLIKKWCEGKGIDVYTSTKVAAIGMDASKKLSVQLDKGNIIEADLVISAAGVSPNINFLQDSNIKVDEGILVNDYLQSNIDGIYAAGDVCQGKDFSTGEYSIQAIQPTSAEHGRIAAMNMSDKQVIHNGSVNMNVLDTMGLISSSYGLWMGVDGGESTSLCDEDNYRYLKLEFKEDTLVGSQSLGLTQHVGVLRGLIQTKLKLGKWKQRLLDDPTRLMEAYIANTQANL